VVDGCDTVFAVYPEWRDTWDSVTPSGVADQISTSPRRICITGGEPLIQPKKQMEEFVEILRRRHHLFDLFTNGSRLLPDWALLPQVTIIMDYKLPGSGEYGSFDYSNLELLTNKDALKFVVKDDRDVEVALGMLDQQRLDCQIYFGPVWGTDTDWVVSEVFPHAPKAKLNLQTHKYIWDPDERAR
jgi:7-carboxy-7-deazaguanine synthase